MMTGLFTTRPKKSVITLVWWSIANDYQAQRVLCIEKENSFANEGAFIVEVPYLEH